MKRDIERGLQCLSKWKGEERLCICHGLSGVYLIFRACAKSLNNPKYLAEAEEVREKILIRDKIAIKEFGDLTLFSFNRIFTHNYHIISSKSSYNTHIIPPIPDFH